MTRSEMIDVNAYLDGELGPEEAAEIEARLAEDPEAQSRFHAYATQKSALGDALAALPGNTPDNLRTARLQRRLAAEMHRRSAPQRPTAFSTWTRSAAQVAAACALVTLGWWGHTVWAPTASGSATYVSATTSVPEYVSEAVGAHRVFAEDMVRPAEFTGGAIDSAAEWFSSKIGTAVNAPDLSGFDMTLVGARLLGTKEGPLAQFIYEDMSGDRYSLTLARHPDDRPVEALHVVDYPDRAVGYWSTPEIDFALIGNRNGTTVQNVANTLASNI